MQVNPKLLEEAPKVTGGLRQRPTTRDGSLSWLVLMKNAFSSVLERTTLKVEMSNGNEYLLALKEMRGQLSAMSQRIAQLKIVVPEIKIPQTSVTVNNPDVEKVARQLANFEATVQTSYEDLETQLTSAAKVIEQALKENKIAFPQMQKIQGEVKVTNIPSLHIFDKLLNALQEVKQAVGNIQIEVPKQQEIKIPAMPKTIGITEGKEILKALGSITQKLDELPKSFPDFPEPYNHVVIDNFPPQKIPQPVTNISINALAGTTKSRSITVGTTPTPLPDEVLSSRRSLVLYNNSSQTLYVGGSDVTINNGMPVPASSYSPAFDAGEKMVVYGIVAATTANVRTLEASDIRTGR